HPRRDGDILLLPARLFELPGASPPSFAPVQPGRLGIHGASVPALCQPAQGSVMPTIPSPWRCSLSCNSPSPSPSCAVGPGALPGRAPQRQPPRGGRLLLRLWSHHRDAPAAALVAGARLQLEQVF